MKSFKLTIVLIFALANGTFAQGLMGKHAVLKLDVLNGIQTPIQGLQFEYAVSRRTSITLGYNFGTSSIRPEYRVTYMTQFLEQAKEVDLIDYDFSSAEIEALLTDNTSLAYSFGSFTAEDVYDLKKRSISVTSSVFSFGFRSYFSSIFAAPGGSYFSMEYYRGKQLATGLIPLPVLEQDYQDFFGPYSLSDTRFKKVTNEEFRFSSLQINFGKQWLLASFLTLDFTYGLSFSTTRASRARGDLFGSYLARNNGANFGAVGYPKGDETFFTTNYRTGSVGLNLYLRLGILLF